MMKVTGDGYSVEYDNVTESVFMIGTIRLPSGQDYEPLVQLLQDASKQNKNGILKLDLRQLLFINSSGINAISKFVISTRKNAQIKLNVIGSKDVYWHQKSLYNLNRLWSDVKIEIN